VDIPSSEGVSASQVRRVKTLFSLTVLLSLLTV
jgi:hypothetical protein